MCPSNPGHRPLACGGQPRPWRLGPPRRCIAQQPRQHARGDLCSGSGSSNGSSDGGGSGNGGSDVGAPSNPSSSKTGDAPGASGVQSTGGGGGSAGAGGLSPEWFEARRVQYNRMRHERDRANRRARLREARAQEEAQLAALTPEQRAARAEEARRLRAREAGARREAAAEALAGTGAGLRVVVDCSYVTQADELHAPRHGARVREITAQANVRSLAKQLEMAMAANRRSAHPVALTLTSFRGDLAAFCDHAGGGAWPVARRASHVLDAFESERGSLVMLTPDADEALDGPPDLGKIYVIGGIVDKSVIKGLSLGWARGAGVAAARLPVREHAAALGMDFDGANKTPVLAICDVVAALREAAANGGDWPAALAAALPARLRRGARGGRGGAVAAAAGGGAAAGAGAEAGAAAAG